MGAVAAQAAAAEVGKEEEDADEAEDAEPSGASGAHRRAADTSATFLAPSPIATTIIALIDFPSSISQPAASFHAATDAGLLTSSPASAPGAAAAGPAEMSAAAAAA